VWEWPDSLDALVAGDVVRRDHEGALLTDSRVSGAPEIGTAAWIAPMPPHTVENVGGSEIRLLNVEMKSG
jgi:hypothetical protein